MYHAFRGVSDHPAGVWKHNVVAVSCKKKGGYRTAVSEKHINPTEKPFQANGWVIGTFSQPGTVSHFLISCREPGGVTLRRVWVIYAGGYGDGEILCDV